MRFNVLSYVILFIASCYTSTYNVYLSGYIIDVLMYLQKGGPSAAGAFVMRPSGPTSFRKFYERGDLPIALEHDTKGNKIAWKVSLVIKIKCD